MMKLGQLLQALGSVSHAGSQLTHAQADCDVVGISADSRHVSTGSVFVAIAGTTYDGHSAIGDSIKKGATAVIVEHMPASPLPVPCIQVSNTRLAYAQLVVAFHGNPSSRLHVFGVTGTNGKTTCATLVEQLYTEFGRNVGFIGTTGNRYGGAEHQTNYSTPHVGELSMLFQDMSTAKVDTVCMEVSSHALDQYRVYGIDFRGAIFTNLTRDHLDYHGTMEKYAQAKKKLFDGLSPEAVAVLWGDSEWTPYMKRHCPARTAVTVGTGRGNQVLITDVKLDVTGTTFTLLSSNAELVGMPDRLTITTKLLGDFNVANVALVAVMAILDGLPADKVAAIIPLLRGPKGRMEVHHTYSGATAIVDYAHTPDALENVLRVARNFTDYSSEVRKIHVVFGCGGDRDKGKRSEMGRIASSLADSVVITNDNPRTEHPKDIVNNIMSGVDADDFCKVQVIEDRRSAIHATLDQASPADVVIVAGKGHEEYQIIGEQRIPFSDSQEILAWSAKHKKAPLE